MTIRPADPARDAAACAAIYAPSVESTPISFELAPPDATEFARRIERYSATHQFLVAEKGGEVVGYAYACRWRERPAYDWAVEVSVASELLLWWCEPGHTRTGGSGTNGRRARR